MALTKDFAKLVRAKLTADPDLAEAVEGESFNTDVALKVYHARTSAGLTQKQLAERVGTQQSVISRIEDADYDGHSLGLLRRIAGALGLKLRVDFWRADASQNGAAPKGSGRPRRTSARTHRGESARAIR